MRTIYILFCLSLYSVLCLPGHAQSNRGAKLELTKDNTSTKRTAFLIGNAEYKKAGTLRNPLNDIKDMAAALRALDFEVVTQTNLDREAMDTVVNNWGKTLTKYGVALFYYAGHGAEVDGVNYLFPIDASPQNQAQVKYQTQPGQYGAGLDGGNWSKN